MKNKKLLAMALLPLSLMQTVSAWFATKDTSAVIIELLKFEKIPEYRRLNQRNLLDH